MLTTSGNTAAHKQTFWMLAINSCHVLLPNKMLLVGFDCKKYVVCVSNHLLGKLRIEQKERFPNGECVSGF